MMKKILLMIMMALVSLAAMAQYSVKFQVNDSTGEGEPFATVRLYAKSDTTKVLSTGITTLEGSYRENLSKAGAYVAKIAAVGKVTAVKTFEVNGNNASVDLGTIVLDATGNILDGVTVTGHAPVVKNEIDRISYNLQNDDDSKTNTVFEMLKKVPLVTIDGQDNILVRGNSSFKIYKNGHPDATMSQNPKEVLKSIPASMIKRIEVITDPGAKYDAEGVNAILNIVTTDVGSMSGVTGSVGVGVDQHGNLNGNGYLTAQFGKVVTSINYGYHRQSRNGNHQSTESVTNYVKSGNQLTSTTEAENDVNVHYGQIEASYEPDTLNLFSLSFGGYYYNYTADGTGTTTMLDASGNKIYSFGGTSHYPTNSYYSFDGRFDYQHKTHVKDEALTLSYMISTSRNKEEHTDSYQDMVGTSFPYTGLSQWNKENFIEHTLQFDWTRPFAKYNKIETGVKYIYRSNKSHTLMDYVDYVAGNQDTRFNHLTQVGAAYLSYTYAKDKWSARAGLRYEYSYLSAKYPDGSQSNYHSNLSDWVPSASVNYQFDMFNSLKLAYSTTINRPGISYLNPAIIEDPTSKSFGNSHLKSAHNQLLVLTYMHIGQKLTFNLSPGIEFTNNSIGAVQYLDDQQKMTSTYDNNLHKFNVGVNGYAQWNMTKSTQLMLNANVGYQRLKSNNLGISNSGWYSFCFANLTQQLPWNLRLSAMGGLFKRGPEDLYGRMGTNTFHAFSLQRSFLKDDRLTVKLGTRNPFGGKYHCIKNYTTQGDYTGTTKSWHMGRLYVLEVSLRFGSLKASVKKTNTTINNDDLVGGNSKGGQQGM